MAAPTRQNALFWKMGLSIGGRALSFALCQMGCSGGLALAIVFAGKALLTAEVSTPDLAQSMMPKSSQEPAHAPLAESVPSALEERIEELILENVEQRKGALGGWPKGLRSPASSRTRLQHPNPCRRIPLKLEKDKEKESM
ncbi:hypothetical protein CRG98_044583 [Punica granatum]|uniref:Uncharacterized protein n=1 Tax=Punica granatum TaxID=22663 RepID=A0A2I0HTJ5_PUNGR|nr:hypothetical protein CRG98_044583 [Punica granatum]